MAQFYNENIELCVLSSLFKDASLYPLVEDFLERQDFGWKPYGLIYKSFGDIVSSDMYPDVETLIADLDSKNLLSAISVSQNGLSGSDAIRFIASMDVNQDNIESYAYQVKRFRSMRQLSSLKDKISTMLEDGKTPDEILAVLDIESGKISSFLGLNNKNTRTAKDVVQSNISQFQDTVNGKVRYISTKLAAWDDFVGGLASRLYMIAARSNEGKSSLVLNLIRNIAILQKIKVKLFTFESSAEEINNKLAQIKTGISAIRIEKAKLSEGEMAEYEDALKEIGESPILYDDSSEISLPLLRTKIRRAVADGARVIFIDQIEQVQIGGGGDNQPEYIKINYIAYRIKAYQREMDVPIVIVHQLNRANESGENRNKVVDPKLTDLAQAGEKAPDAVLMLRTKTNPAFFWEKNRQGEKGKREVKWTGYKLLFEDIPGTTMYPTESNQQTMDEAFGLQK